MLPKCDIRDTLTIETYEHQINSMIPLSQLPVALFTCDPKSSFICCNDTFASLYGFKDKDEIMMEMHHFFGATAPGTKKFSPDFQNLSGLSSKDRFDQIIHDTFLENDGTITFDWEILKNDGKPCPVSVLSTGIIYQNRMALQLIPLPYQKYSNPKQKYANCCRPLCVHNFITLKTLDHLKPAFWGDLNINLTPEKAIGGAESGSKSITTKIQEQIMIERESGSKISENGWMDNVSCFVDGLGKNLYLMKKHGEKDPFHAIAIDTNLEVRDSEKMSISTFTQQRPNTIELWGPHSRPIHIQCDDVNTINKFKFELLKKIQEEKERIVTLPMVVPVSDLIETLIDKKDTMSALELFYAHDVVTSDNLDHKGRVGKRQNQKYFLDFFKDVDFKEREVGRIAIHEEKRISAIEYFFKFELKGEVFERNQIQICEWNRQNKIVREDNYFNDSLRERKFPKLEELSNFALEVEKQMLKSGKYKSAVDILENSTKKCADKYIKNLVAGDNIKFFDECFENSMELIRTENGIPRMGFDNNRKHEKHFKKNGKWTQLPTIKRTITQGPLFVCEYSYEIEVSGKNIKRNQVSVSVIRDGKICREDFYYDDVSKKKASDVKEKSKTCLIV